jgi:hypothetical protein
LSVAYFLEVGLLLILVPWSDFWERNYFVQTLPALESIVGNNYVRGAVSGLGVINLVVGLGELLGLIAARRPYDEPIAAHPDLRPEEGER